MKRILVIPFVFLLGCTNSDNKTKDKIIAKDTVAKAKANNEVSPCIPIHSISDTTHYFEGNIKYKCILEGNLLSTHHTLEDTFYVFTANMFIKDGSYITYFDRGEEREESYSETENVVCKKYHGEKYGADTISCGIFTPRSKPEKLIKCEFHPKKEKILGIVCDEYIQEYKHAKVAFYFNNDTLKLRPDWYTHFQFTYGNMINTDGMNSMYLKCRKETDDFIVTQWATSIVKQRVHPARFLNIKKVK